MKNFSCFKCNLVANALSNSCPSCGDRFYSVNDKRRALGVATLLCVAIAVGFFTLVQSVPAIAS